MTDLDQQKLKAQQFSMSMFGAVATGATTHFLAMVDRELKAKEAALLQDGEKTSEEINEELQKFNNAIVQNAHLLIRQHTALIVGGFTKDMFPSLYPKEEKPDTALEPEVIRDPEPIIIGVEGIPSEERVFGAVAD